MKGRSKNLFMIFDFFRQGGPKKKIFDLRTRNVDWRFLILKLIWAEARLLLLFNDHALKDVAIQNISSRICC
jgi:hypothetical protein